ncbi:CDGSH iron-sulfur domain-containing protein [Paenibacillus sp. P26]|nr:CDGSH iron-sulfur domain-containing protein [Paenibacillus sp. P26]
MLSKPAIGSPYAACGRSNTQPFCDGTHKACGFREASAAK